MGRGATLRILGASIRRHWRIMLRYPFNVFSWLIWPTLFGFSNVFVASALAGPSRQLSGFVRTAGTADYVGFLCLGVVVWEVMNSLLWTFGLSLRREQMSGTLEQLWMAPVPRVLLMVGRGVSDLLFAFLIVFLSLVEFRLLFGMRLLIDPLALTVLVAATIPALYGMGLGFASLVLWVKEANAAVFFVRGIFTIFAGLTYPLDVLPQWMRTISAMLPLTYTVEGVRASALRGASLAEVAPLLPPLLILGSIFLVFGQAAFWWSEARVRRVGTIGAF